MGNTWFFMRCQESLIDATVSSEELAERNMLTH